MSSKLQRYVGKKLGLHFGGKTIRENTRPDWMITERGARLELDFFVEELDIAIEVQGEQHYRYVPFFHGDYRRFEQRREWDEFKRRRCAEKGVTLFEVASRLDADLLIKDLLERKEKRGSGHGKYYGDGSVYRGRPQAPGKARIKKMIKTIVSYRNSNPGLSRAAHDELNKQFGDTPQVKALARRCCPVPPEDLPEFCTWLWE